MSLLTLCVSVSCFCDSVINHLLYVDDIVLLAPSTKGLKRLLFVIYAYGFDNGILFCSLKSQVMYVKTLCNVL